MNTDKKTDGALSVEDTLKLALEALENPWKAGPHGVANAITAIRKVLAEQPAQPCGYPYCGCNSKAWCKLERMAENARQLGLDYVPAQQQEPVGQLQEEAYGRGQVMWFNKPADQSMLYTSPQPSKPLTDEEIKRMAAPLFMSHYWNLCNEFARAIESAHGIKEKTHDF